ncbi:SGNH/GDSL hydrolase family protein [Thiotrichales bacterium 19X7-9]|nr:SGNH/GDSL hydrolase family protein [Thiotrichales bacterium 19X7-9]
MKTILCYGDSNLRGFIPGSFNETTGLSGRYDKNQRWSGLLQQKLGNQYDVIEDGVNGRTTNLDEITPGRADRNGLKSLPVALEAAFPVDLVIFWLGTNDTKLQFNRNADEIAKGLKTLINLVKLSEKGPNGVAPEILIIAPQPVIKINDIHPEFALDADEKSNQLANAYQKLAEKENCHFFDVGQIITSSLIDGVHIDENDNKTVAEVIYNKVLETLEVYA